MNNIYAFISNVRTNAPMLFNTALQQTRQWASHTIQVPQAVGAILAINTLAFIVLRAVANYVERQLDVPLNLKGAKHLLTSGIIMGGGSFAVNKLLSRALLYPLSPYFFVATAIIHIGGRILINQVQDYFAKQKQALTQTQAKLAEAQTERQELEALYRNTRNQWETQVQILQAEKQGLVGDKNDLEQKFEAILDNSNRQVQELSLENQKLNRWIDKLTKEMSELKDQL